MPRPTGRTLPVLLGAAILVGGVNLAAYAVNGRPIIQGLTNTGTVTTTIDNNGTGPALRLRGRDNQPSLAVSSTRRVDHLNADRVDGRDGADLVNDVVRYTLPPVVDTSGQAYRFPDLPAGRYWVSYSVYASAADGAVWCEMEPADTTAGQQYELISNGGSFATPAGAVVSTPTASGVVDARGTSYSLTCHAESGLFTIPAGNIRSQVSFLRIDVLGEQVPTS